MKEQLNEVQKYRINSACDKIKEAIEIIDTIENEFYKLGSFPESGFSYVSHDLKNTISYMKGWNKEGVEI